ncbi:MAG: ATP phosphoribosyltransferase regulatory subunit [Clostridia bacterium]|nr:ATP phosphoribosyltransferase regulatory subunit [Clostridia bacterium]
MSELILKEEERISLSLRSLYKKYGYQPYKMSKFEEYDLYVTNKEFLVGDGVITFNDTDGKLLALKPDVTLSIIRNSVNAADKRKVYYDENVYRISAKTKQFKEIRQVGLECIGDVGIYDEYETVTLAAASLAEISEDFVLDVSHLGVLSAILNSVSENREFQSALMFCLAEKNVHEAESICDSFGVSEEDKKRLSILFTAYGAPQEVLEKLAPVCKGKAKAAFKKLQTLCKLLGNSKYAKKIRLDFSVVNDMNYYSDIVFKGFIDGVAEGVLSGGRYDKLMVRMGKNVGAVGFAVYLDLLEGFREEKSATDVDVLILYNEKTSITVLVKMVEKLTKKGYSVSAQTCKTGLRYGECVDLRGGNV